MCGACTVHLDGQAVRSCVTAVADAASSAAITTVEAIGETGRRAPASSKAWLAEEVVQCGCCQ